ncbi:hypothetical protein F2Q68_00005254 [Brassica cretica]|uniref:Arabidopsis retrotransposon Orf1 C-terminal domain-containing protein n=1 Tax=Brassica cretica TaxID=69181 RepID=A0A8S9JCZ3_BRACR|nr:hypothetical protein F2Q68_00005254 [Brassica cretica]
MPPRTKQSATRTRKTNNTPPQRAQQQTSASYPWPREQEDEPINLDDPMLLDFNCERWDKETTSRYNTLLKAEILPTLFCHAETLAELGIDEDVFETLHAMGIAPLCYATHELYPDFVRQVLTPATISYEDFSAPSYANCSFSFMAEGEYCSLSLDKHNEIYEIANEPRGLAVAKKSAPSNTFWDFIANGNFTPGKAYHSQIRNPTLRVIAKIISNLLFAKDQTSKVTNEELQTLNITNGASGKLIHYMTETRLRMFIAGFVVSLDNDRFTTSARRRPTALHDRTRDSDDEEVHDRDYDLAGLANNLNQFTRYNMQENNGAEEEHGSNDRDEEDVYFDDESAEVVVSSLRLGDEQANNLFANSNWFTFQGDELGENTRAGGIPSEEAMEDVSLDETSGNGDEEEDCLITESKNPFVATASTSEAVSVDSIPGGIEIDEDVVSDESSPERVERGDASSPTAQVKDPFPEDDVKMPDVRVSNGSSSSEGEISPRSPPVPSLFEKDIEFVGVEPEGTERAMDQALKEGIVGEAGPMKRSSTTASPGKESSDENMQQEYNDTNYWKVDQEVAVVE